MTQFQSIEKTSHGGFDIDGIREIISKNQPAFIQRVLKYPALQSTMQTIIFRKSDKN